MQVEVKPAVPENAVAPQVSHGFGLALSGGGFRASFFHLGVLAALAEKRMLRHVEVISTVSGGSILGAAYYLRLKRMLEEHPDDSRSPNEWDTAHAEVVADVIGTFLKVVPKNLRMRTFANPRTNLRMMLKTFSRSDAIGELYAEYLYEPTLLKKRGDDVEGKPVLMRELPIEPAGHEGAFVAGEHNGARRAKVPRLVLNATSLNTGRDWWFEVETMGEPPVEDEVTRDLDQNMRLLRPTSYADMVKRQRDMPLGIAVAASAAVPVIFPPMAVSDLYRDIRVELVDGGVHDNQGLCAVRDSCRRILVSDASGQLSDEDNPSTTGLAVAARTNLILMDRVREAELLRLREQKGSDMGFVHLRRGLVGREIPWLRGKGEVAPPPDRDAQPDTSFGVHPEIQELLADIRTDLDSFSEIEAHALMLDGYLMTLEEIGKEDGLGSVAESEASLGRKWVFETSMRGHMKAEPTPHLKRCLRAGRHQFLKAFHVTSAAWVLAAALVAVAAAGAWQFRGAIPGFLAQSFTIGEVLAIAAASAVVFVAARLLPRSLRWVAMLVHGGRYVRRFAASVAVAIVAPLPILFHLATFDMLFKRAGRIASLPPVKVVENEQDTKETPGDSGFEVVDPPRL